MEVFGSEAAELGAPVPETGVRVALVGVGLFTPPVETGAETVPATGIRAGCREVAKNGATSVLTVMLGGRRSARSFAIAFEGVGKESIFGLACAEFVLSFRSEDRPPSWSSAESRSEGEESGIR